MSLNYKTLLLRCIFKYNWSIESDQKPSIFSLHVNVNNITSKSMSIWKQYLSANTKNKNTICKYFFPISKINFLKEP